MLTPRVKATLFIPTPTTPTPTRERRSLLPGQLFGLRTRNSPRSRRPARVNLRATKGSGGTPTTAYLTATKLVPRKKTARSSEASVNSSALPLRSITARILRPEHPRRSPLLQIAWEVLRPTGNHVGSGNPQAPIPPSEWIRLLDRGEQILSREG